MAIKSFKKGSTKKAATLIKNLLQDIEKAYSFNFEGKPLVHDIYRSMAACQSKMGLHKDALETLNTTLSWQLVCEGKTSNVAQTETMIQSVSRTCGNKEELSKSMQRLEEMKTEIDSSESRMGSGSASSLNESMVSISM